jgi:hypothetical protein
MIIQQRLSQPLLLAAILLGSMAAVVCADEPTTIKLTLHPQAIDEHGPSRPLLPESPDLMPGNAAVVLLRMPWAQRTWMEEWSPKLFELLELPPGDPRVAEFPFDRFAAEMRRAAFMRNADWAYPLEDESLDSISTPDILELPIFFRGMSIWTDQRIAAGDLDAAREGVLTMLACSRHVARTPMSIPHLVARGTAEAALSRVESLISQPHSPNLHASLSLLPDAIGDCRAALQWEAQNPKRLLPALRNGVPSSGDTQGWKAVMDDFLRWESNPWRKEETISADLEARRLELAAEARAAVARGGYAVPDRPISEDELGMGYLLAKTARAYFRAEAAWRLPPPDAIRALADMNAETDAISPQETKTSAPFLAMYAATEGFGRRARLLEVVEALRDALARNGGRFPASLADVPAHVPHDPFTGKSFPYEPAADGRSARLSATPIPDIDNFGGSGSALRIYELTIATE